MDFQTHAAADSRALKGLNAVDKFTRAARAIQVNRPNVAKRIADVFERQAPQQGAPIYAHFDPSPKFGAQAALYNLKDISVRAANAAQLEAETHGRSRHTSGEALHRRWTSLRQHETC